MPGPLGRFTSSGSLPSGESFIYQMYVQRNDAGNMTIADLVAAADAWQNALKTSGTPLVSAYSPTTVWSLIQADLVDVSSGHSTERGFGTVSMLGTASGGVNPLPPGVAVAVTLRSTVAGPTGRGRFYLPPPNVGQVSTTGRLSTAGLAQLAGALANAFTALAGLTNPIEACIYSRTHRLVHPAIKGDVGDVFDSMRTRRDKLIEARSPVFG